MLFDKLWKYSSSCNASICLLRTDEVNSHSKLLTSQINQHTVVEHYGNIQVHFLGLKCQARNNH